ncbi:sister chromatid cohesion 1 protein 1 [Medicago truncatula]|nr:sister chromatid cohesion 1 protein 1 [Medicago truncatula]
MFYSHQLLARKAPLGQIWMAATMHAKINRKKLNKLNIIKICEEILNPAIPMALRLSGILMGGVVIVYERKVKLLYDDVSRLLVEINEAWKVKSAPDPTVLPKGKSQAKRNEITIPNKERGSIEEDIGNSYQSTATTATRFHRSAYFSMRLDTLDLGNERIEEEDPSVHHHQADPDNITLPERFQADAVPHNQYERFEGDEETQVNGTSGDCAQFGKPSPPPPNETTIDDIIEDQHPEHPVIQQSNDNMNAREEPQRRRPAKRKRGKPIQMDFEQTMIPSLNYQNWLQDPSDLVSRRGGIQKVQKRHDIMSSFKIVNLMEVPPVALYGGLLSTVNKDIYYPSSLLDLWIKSTQPPHDSPSVRISADHPPEPSSTSPPGVQNNEFTGHGSEEFGDGRLDNILYDSQGKLLPVGEELPENIPGYNGTPQIHVVQPEIFPGGGDNSYSVRTASEHGHSSHSDLEGGRDTKRKRSSSRKSGGGLHGLPENEKFNRLSDFAPTPDQELLVETGPTPTQGNPNHSSDKITKSIQAQMKAHFDTHKSASGAPQFVSLDILAAGMTKKSAAILFYQTCVLATRDVLRVEQKEPYGEILIFRGPEM